MRRAKSERSGIKNITMSKKTLKAALVTIWMLSSMQVPTELGMRIFQ
jgi:hypothetical protein